MADVEMADAEPAQIKPLASSPFLLIDISTAQAQHGLRHGDYARYRCAESSVLVSAGLGNSS